MSEVGPADRSRLLRSKRNDLSGIVTSRKRKLREFFAVCDNEGPVPQTTYSSPDAPPTTAAEERFLDVTDILKDRLFDESNLPTRRQLRSETAKQRTPIRKVSLDTHPNWKESSKITKPQRDGSKPRKSRAPTPSAKSDGGRPPVVENGIEPKERGIPMERSTSKSSQTDLPAESAVILGEIVEETFQHATKPSPQIPDNPIPPRESEAERIRSVLESRPNSPGVDPRKAMPILAEDAAQLSEPLVEGLGSHDVHHKATTAHLPPKEVQEKHLRDVKQARQEKAKEASSLAIKLPRDGGPQTELASSPGSTNGAQSATTPALHDASTDTSPDNEGSRYDSGPIEKDAQTPPELRATPEEVAEKAEHDRILNAQIEIARGEILGSSPTAADKQLRMEEEAASLNTIMVDARGRLDRDSQNNAAQRNQEVESSLTKEASEVVEDIVEDTDAAVDARTAGDVEMSGTETKPNEVIGNGVEPRQREVPDSENEGGTPIDAMDVENRTAKDSFESGGSIRDNPPSPATATTPEAPENATVDSKRSSNTPTAPTPHQAPPTPVTAIAPPVAERMTTRITSGSMRHKSVSEILGEIPRPNTTSSSDRTPARIATDSGSTENSSSPSRSSTPQSPGTRMRSLVEKAKERERSKLSTVTFSRRAKKPNSNDNALVPSGSQIVRPQDDYLMPLFVASATSDKRGIPALDSLLATAHKTITTANAYLPIQESQTSKVLKRIYHLQSNNKWSLRQPKRAVEPNRPTTHWDVLLQEVKWMRTDFREERKWKMTVARNLAFACAEWLEADPEDRKLLQVKATPPKSSKAPSNDAEMSDAQDIPHLTPDLVASGEFDSPMDDFDEEPRLNLMDTVAPTAIFALQDDDVIFGLRRSPTADKLLNELPMYGAPLSVPQSGTLTSIIDPDRIWRRPALPLSKYVEGKMELKSEGPPRKKSRYQYEEEEDDEDEVVFGDPGQKRPVAPPEKSDVALFDPQHKHIRDRIHSSHQFRPPSEFPMPLQSFFETRVPSQWTWDEDNELKCLVRDYTYNWSLISSMLTSKSMFSSGPERRTPWECFERWVQLEGLPTDMQKTHYFRAYTSRIEAANRAVMQAAAAAQPQPMANGQMQQPPRRRTTASVRVDRRKNQKHLTLVDAMRKLAKRRETTQQKANQAAGMAALRKANENQQPPAQPRNVHTPQEFSRLKHDRELQIQERILQLQQRQEQQRRQQALLQQQQRAAQQGGQPGGPPNGGPQARPPPANGPQPTNGPPGQNGQNLTVPGQQNRIPRPMPPQMAQQMGQQMQNGLRVPQVPMNGVPQAPMQAMQGQLPMPNPAVSVGLINQAAQTAEQQRAMIQMQQQGKPPGQSPQVQQNSPPRTNGMPQPGPGFAMQNMMAFNGNDARAVVSPPINGMVPSPGQAHGQAGSPRMVQHSPPHETYVGQLEVVFKKKYPSASQETIRSMIQQQLKSGMANSGMAQNAMNAAAGGLTNATGAMGGMNGQGHRVPPGVESSPQLYAQMLRQQQESQQKAEQARQAAAAASQNGAGPGPGGPSNGQQAQGHAHRNSSGSVHSTK